VEFASIHSSFRFIISSGREGHEPVTGNFQIIQKDKAYESSLLGDYAEASCKVIQQDMDIGKHDMPKGAHHDECEDTEHYANRLWKWNA
jgi:hypothetical protein